MLAPLVNMITLSLGNHYVLACRFIGLEKVDAEVGGRFS